MFRVARQRLLKWHALSRTVLLAAIVALTACSDEGQSPTMPARPEVPKQISDGARQGNPHFFFLPPLVKQPLVTGVVDPNVGPSVVICELDAASKCSTIVAQFTREVNAVDQSEVDAPGEVRFNGNHYYAFWNTQQCLTGPCQLDPARKYRIRVMVGSTELGHADVNLVQGQSALKNVDTNEFIGLVDGKKLPLKFRIEVGAVDVVAPGEAALVGNAGGEVSTTDGEVSIRIPSNALAAETPITVEKVTEERPQTGEWADVVELGPDGTNFAYPVTLTLRYDVTKLPPGVPPEALKMSTWVNDHWEEVPGSTLNLEDGTISAPISHFSSYSLSMWPNAVQGAPGPQLLYVGQAATMSGTTWYYQTVPYQRCYIAWRWVPGGFNGGSWRPYERCDTYVNAYSYPMYGGYVTFTSQNPAVMSVASPGYAISDSNGQVTSPLLSANSPGTSMVTARFSNVSVGVTYTVQPQLVFDVFGTGTAPTRKFGLRQGTGLRTRIPAAAASNLTVSFAHSDISVLQTNPSVVIPAGSTEAGVTMIAGTTVGTDIIVGSAPGYGPDTLVVATDLGRIYVENWPTSLNYGDSAAIRIRPMAPDSSIIDNAWLTTFQLSSGGNLAFSRNNAAITSITVPDGTSSTPVFYVKAIGGGAASMTVTNAWYVTGPYDVTIVGQPKLVLDVFGTGTASFRKFGFGQGTGMNVRIPAAVASPVNVLFSHSNLAVAGSNSGVTIAAGSTQNGVTIGAGQTAGRDTLIASAAGYAPDTLVIETGPGVIYVEGWPTTLAFGDSAPIRLRPMNQDSTVIDNAWNTTFTLASNGRLQFRSNGAVITSIAVPNGSSATPTFYVKAIGFSPATATITNTMYNTRNLSLNVSPPNLVGAQSVCGHAITGIGFDGTSYWVGEGHDGLLQCLSKFNATTGVLTEVKQIFLDHRGVHWVPALNRLTSRTWGGPIFSIDPVSGNLLHIASNPTQSRPGDEQSQPAVDPDGVSYWILWNGNAERRQLSNHALLNSFPVTSTSGWNVIAVSQDWVFTLDGTFANAYAKGSGRLSGRQPLPTAHGCNYFGFGVSVNADRIMYARTCTQVQVVPVTVTFQEPTGPVFSLTDLGTLGGTGSSEAVTLNNAGRIVGNSNFAGFYRDANASSLTQVPNHIGDIYWAHGVNEAGVIAWTQPYVGFTWDPATNARIGPPPGPFANNNRLLVGALNNTGMVLACSDNGSYAQNYVWVIATNTTSLIPGSANFCGGRINDAGVAVANADPGAGGNSRLWYQATQTFTMIPSLGGMVVGRDINNSSIAVGGSQVNGKWHAFRYDPATGQTRDLGTLGGLESEAMGINDAGFIVGWSLNAAGQKRGFIWDPVADRMFEIPPLAGYADAQANDINQSGVIVGFSANGSVRRATRWTPQ